MSTMDNRPDVIFANKPPDGEEWVMECKFSITNGERHAELDCFATKMVVSEFLKIMWEVARDGR